MSIAKTFPYAIYLASSNVNDSFIKTERRLLLFALYSAAEVSAWHGEGRVRHAGWDWGAGAAGGADSSCSAGTLFYFYFYFILLYNTVLVLPYIDMNPPWVYMSSQT